MQNPAKDRQKFQLRDAIFLAGLTTTNRKDPPRSVRKLFFADNQEDDENFKPDTYLDITAVFETWMQACEGYPMWRGQTSFRFSNDYSSLAVMRGCLSGFRDAVALMSNPAERPDGLVRCYETGISELPASCRPYREHRAQTTRSHRRQAPWFMFLADRLRRSRTAMASGGGSQGVILLGSSLLSLLREPRGNIRG